LNDLTSMGVSGFRVDACKHMWPGDLDAIFSSLNDLPTSKGFSGGSRPFIFQEVIDQGGKLMEIDDQNIFCNCLMYGISLYLWQHRDFINFDLNRDHNYDVIIKLYAVL